MGRRSTLTPGKRKKIARLIATGMTNADAAHSSGISKAIFYRWMAWGREKKEQKYIDFLDSIEEAQAGFKKTHLQNIENAALSPYIKIIETIRRGPDGSITKEIRREHLPPKAELSRWLLESKFPDEFATGKQPIINNDINIENKTIKIEFV